MDEEQKNVEVQDTTTSASNTPNERKGFNVTALLLGLISVVTSFFYWYAALPAGLLAIIFAVGGKKDAGKGIGTVGVICAIAGLMVCIIKAVI